MKHLSELIDRISPLEVLHFRDDTVSDVKYLAHDLNPSDMFACIDEFLEYGRWMKGFEQLPDATAKNPSAFILEHLMENSDFPQIIVENAIQSMAVAAKALNDNPDEQLSLIGVTGTNGKTTICHLIHHILSVSGISSSSLGTIGLFVNGAKQKDAIFTTPLSPDLFRTFSELVKLSVKACAFEVSSHSLKLDRVYGIAPDAAVFSNLTRDHLDFHSSFDDYRESKTKLFEMVKPNGVSVINLDDPYGKEMAKHSGARVIFYGIREKADLRAVRIHFGRNGTDMHVRFKGQEVEISSPLIARFNVYNILAAMGVGLGMGLSLSDMKDAVHSFQGASGRMERIPLKNGMTGVVDYAHTPDALEKIIEAVKEITDGRVITVFGCGGDRDRGKRPIMGKLAGRLSDCCVITSDNPRTEDPDRIIRDILEGFPGDHCIVEPDRRKAIRKAVETGKKGDIILVAGKGHEPYQIIGNIRIPFNDMEELSKWKSGKTD